MDSHECVPPHSKTCSKCGETKPLTEFSRSKAKPKAECKACFAAYHRAYYEKNRDKVLARTKAYQAANQEVVAQRQADWYQRNKQHVLERSKTWQQSNKARETERLRAWYDARKVEVQATRKAKLLADPDRKARFDEYQKRYYEENRHLWTEKSARRNRALQQATPAWADFKAIRAVYRACMKLTDETGQRHEVDHIVPLRGRNVCGLHVEHNLRIVTLRDNRVKGNKLIEG